LIKKVDFFFKKKPGPAFLQVVSNTLNRGMGTV